RRCPAIPPSVPGVAIAECARPAAGTAPPAGAARARRDLDRADHAAGGMMSQLERAATAGADGARILLDLTTAYVWRGRRAVGIVRTEREIGLRLLDDPSLCVLPFIFHGGTMRAIEVDFARFLLTESERPGGVDEATPPPAARSALARLI